MVRMAQTFGGSQVEGEGFRGTKGFSSAGTPVYMVPKREFYLYPEQRPFDAIDLQYFTEREFKIEEPQAFVKKVTVPLSAERIRLDELLDKSFSHGSPRNIFDEEGFSQHMYNSVGALPLSRGVLDYVGKENFVADPKKAIQELKRCLEEKVINKDSKIEMQDAKARLEVLMRHGFIKRVNGKLAWGDLNPVYSDEKFAYRIALEYALGALEGFSPEFKSDKKLSLEWFGVDRMLTALEFDKEKNKWKCHGWFQVLEIPGSGKFLYYRDNSTNGSYVIKNGSFKDEVSSLESLAELDKADSTLKPNEKGNTPLVKNFVKEKNGKVQIQMTRTPKRGISPIYNVLLGKLGEKWDAEIRMGSYQPGSELPQNILHISTE